MNSETIIFINFFIFIIISLFLNKKITIHKDIEYFIDLVLYMIYIKEKKTKEENKDNEKELNIIIENIEKNSLLYKEKIDKSQEKSLIKIVIKEENINKFKLCKEYMETKDKNIYSELKNILFKDENLIKKYEENYQNNLKSI